MSNETHDNSKINVSRHRSIRYVDGTVYNFLQDAILLQPLWFKTSDLYMFRTGSWNNEIYIDTWRNTDTVSANSTFKNVFTYTHVYSGIVTMTPPLSGAGYYSLQCFVYTWCAKKTCARVGIGYRLQRKSRWMKWPRTCRTSFYPVNTCNAYDTWNVSRVGFFLQHSASSSCIRAQELFAYFAFLCWKILIWQHHKHVWCCFHKEGNYSGYGTSSGKFYSVSGLPPNPQKVITYAAHR